jgi:UDP-2,3-diacylglucosamine pyrophosphatase LpxH
MSLAELPRHAAIHVISDIHMGGLQGAQILRETGRLAGFIRRVATERSGDAVALVLAGDVFDTLAEDLGGAYVAVEHAQAVVARIMDDASFKPIWQALAEFVHTPLRTLVFVIGNHDIEIALPPVQRLIQARLAGDDLTARARIEFSTMGAGYTCRVGAARVYCIHGNEVDAWNYNRYEDLARLGRRLNAGQPFDPADWRPNAGTKMVKEVMNTVKRRYAWIDLLKPETAAAVGTLLVIDPGQVKKLGELLGIVAERQRGAGAIDARLSVDAGVGPGSPPVAPPTLSQLLGPNLRAAQPARPAADDMLLAAEQQLSGPRTEPDGTLGTGQLIWDQLTGWLTGVDKPEALRRALQDWLRGDKTFDVADHDETFTEVMKTVGASVDIVVTGHTHLARAFPLDDGRLYFNSGTWIRLMRFTEAMLRDQASFHGLYDTLIDGRLATLDAASFDGQPLVMDCTSAIEITAEGNEVVWRLQRIVGDGSGAPDTVVELRRH